jgi:hypothetical protein
MTAEETLRVRDKCPDAPTKKKYRIAGEALDAARERSLETKLDIAAYACPGCGLYHLTRDVTGPDVITRQPDGRVITGRQRALEAEAHAARVVPIRADMTVLEPVRPANPAARRKVLRAWLVEHPEPLTPEVAEVLGVGRAAVGKYMHELGYASRRGTGARWRLPGTEPAVASAPKKKEPAARPPRATRPAIAAGALAGRSIPRTLEPAKVPARGGEPAGPAWVDVDISGLTAYTVESLSAVYAAAGLRLRLQVEVGGDA